VRLTLNGAAQNPPSGVTNLRGEFEITGVPVGSYTLSASRAAYLTLQYGQRRPREAGRTIDVRAGQTIDKLDVRMYRGATLSGRILDESGEPAAGVRLEATELRFMRGRRVPVPVRFATTSDIGEYRMSGLEPGAYQVRATSAEMWESDDGKQTFTYGSTLYPGVATAEQAQTINLAVGQEVGGLDFSLVPGAAARVTGVIENADGTFAKLQVVNLDSISRAVGGGLSGAGFGGSTRTDDRGAFEFPPLASGEYMVYTGTQSDRVGVQVILNPGDTKHVVLRPGRPTAVFGTVVTDENAPPPFPAARLRIIPIRVDTDNPFPVWAAPTAQAVRPDWTFRFNDMDGQYLLRVEGLPSDWMLKSLLLGGQDLVDAPLGVQRAAPDVGGLQLVISRTGATVGGEVVDRAGAPLPDATVIVFGESRGQWGVGSRFVRVVRPDDGGKFLVSGLPAGIYRVTARETVLDGQWEDAEFLQSLMRDALRLELQAGAKETAKMTLPEVR
jgi:protocatechuate 3,4-dioxygenase beta subunit